MKTLLITLLLFSVSSFALVTNDTKSLRCYLGDSEGYIALEFTEDLSSLKATPVNISIGYHHLSPFETYTPISVFGDSTIKFQPDNFLMLEEGGFAILANKISGRRLPFFHIIYDMNPYQFMGNFNASWRLICDVW